MIVEPSNPGPRSRDHGSASSRPIITLMTRSMSSTVAVIAVMQSRDLQAGTSPPTVLIRPRDGLYPTMPLSAAGTRPPDPAVSVATAKGTSPCATARAEPELEPPEIISLP